jgi:hypothetical protein
MSLEILPEVTSRPLKTLFCGVDGSGKSTGAKIYCESRGLKPVCIDFDDTNYTGVPRVNIGSWKVTKRSHKGAEKVLTPESVIKGIIDTIHEVEKSEIYTALIIDGVGTLNNLLLPEGKESQRTYLIRTQNFKKIWRVLLESNIHIIFIGQKDLIVKEDEDSSKFAEMINNMINFRFNCYHTGEGFSNEDFTYVCTKTRNEIEPLIGKPIISEPVTSSIPVTPKEEAPMPHLIKECMDALFERGMEPTEERVRTCIEDRCKNVSDKTVYNECMEWLDNNLTLGGV